MRTLISFKSNRPTIPLVASAARRWGDFSKIKVLLPSLEEQQIILETLSSAQPEINLLKQLTEQYRKQKRGLMPKLLTGEWRVNADKEVA